MVEKIQPGVERLLDSPEERGGVTLIVGVENTSSEVAIDRIEDTGATVEETLFYDNIVVSITEETDLDRLCSLEAVTSVEIEGKWEQMEGADEGNWHIHGTARK